MVSRSHPSPPPIRGDGETNHETDAVRAWLGNPPAWFENQAAECIRQGSPERLMKPLVCAVASEVYGTAMRHKEAEPLVRDALARLEVGG